jgi:putative nucleotidyltransferase with HDIG domain
MAERPTLESLTEMIRSIPTLPAVLGELSRRLEDPKTSSEDLAQVIQKDQALSSKVLKLVNSPFYGYSSRIHSISQGIMILGFNAVKNLVLSTSVLEAFRNVPSGDGFRLEDLWLHSAATSCAAKVLAETSRRADPDEAFVAGLLHDIGKVVLWSAAPDFFRSAVHLSQERRISFGKVLQQTLGFRDEDIGAELALRWKFPASLREAIRRREHSVSKSDENLLAPILQASNLLACASGYHDLPSTPLSSPSPDNWRHLGLDDHERLRAWIHESAPRMQLSCTFLEMLD